MVDLKKPADNEKNDPKAAANQETVKLPAAKKRKKKTATFALVRKSLTIRKDQDEYMFTLAQKLASKRKRVVNISEILRVIIDAHMETARLAREKPVKES